MQRSQQLDLAALSLAAAVLLYVLEARTAVHELEVEVVEERKLRRDAEHLARTRSVQMDQALEKIHELSPDEPQDEHEQPGA